MKNNFPDTKQNRLCFAANLSPPHGGEICSSFAWWCRETACFEGGGGGKRKRRRMATPPHGSEINHSPQSPPPPPPSLSHAYRTERHMQKRWLHPQLTNMKQVNFAPKIVYFLQFVKTSLSFCKKLGIWGVGGNGGWSNAALLSHLRRWDKEAIVEEEDAKTQSLCRSAPLETFSERHFPSLSITKIYISEDFLFSRGFRITRHRGRYCFFLFSDARMDRQSKRARLAHFPFFCEEAAAKR